MLVTVITPSYNHGRFIEETIKSVLTQDYPLIEYIVVDGGSSDNTLEILHRYADRLSWISEPDHGQSDAINKGFRMARGELLAWLNSDDTYEPGAVSKAVNAFRDNPNLALVYGHGGIIDEKGARIRIFEATEPFNLWSLIHKWDYILQPTTFFKKAALEKVGLLRIDLNWCMDWDLWIRLGMNYPAAFVNEMLANSREYAETKTSMGGWRRFREISRLMGQNCSARFPPGLFIYGIDTIAGFFRRRKLFAGLVNRVAAALIGRILKGVPTVYPDGWVGPKAILAVPACAGKAVIQGEAVFEDLFPMKLSVFQAGIFIKSMVIEQPGLFRLEVNLEDAPDQRYQEIMIKTTKRKRGQKPDARHLCWRFKSVEMKMGREAEVAR